MALAPSNLPFAVEAGTTCFWSVHVAGDATAITP